MRGKKPLTAAQPEALEYEAPSSPPHNQPPLACHYFTAHRAVPLSTRACALTAMGRHRRLDLLSRSVFKPRKLKRDEEASWKPFHRLEKLANANRLGGAVTGMVIDHPRVIKG